MGMWAAGLPALDDRLGLGAARLGTALLFVSFGALISMPIAGRLCDRWSSRAVCVPAGPLCALSLICPALAPSYGTLILGALVFGMGLGLLEIAMNVHAVEVERRHPKPILSAFHGVWSLGGAAGGALTAAGLHAGIGSQRMLVVAALAGAVLFLPPARWLLPGAAGPGAGTEAEPHVKTAPRRVGLWRLVLFLGTIVFAGHLSEGAALDWAAVHARDVLEAGPAVAPLAFTVYSVAMTTVRLLGDGLRDRLGAARTIRLSGLVAAAGYALVLLAPVTGGARLGVAWAGWALAGVGLATIVPVVFSAVGAAGGTAGRALSTVTMFGYAGLLGGPPVIGHLADATSLPLALAIPGVLCAYIAAAGPAGIRALAPPGPEPAVRSSVRA
ncbi:MFS transporter [Actinomadura alba]|uniref:MFS transporter n=1 Tax=Actinomadura alba TaxID=406431 RepID=A0ABR7LIW0_9ACTN|nr:MFS transporter [Actinomadura alba]